MHNENADQVLLCAATTQRPSAHCSLLSRGKHQNSMDFEPNKHFARCGFHAHGFIRTFIVRTDLTYPGKARLNSLCWHFGLVVAACRSDTAGKSHPLRSVPRCTSSQGRMNWIAYIAGAYLDRWFAPCIEAKRNCLSSWCMWASVWVSVLHEEIMKKKWRELTEVSQIDEWKFYRNGLKLNGDIAI